LAFVQVAEVGVKCIEFEVPAQGFLAVDDDKYSFAVALRRVLLDFEPSTLVAGSSELVRTS
jgi:hypothetical protein